MLLVGAFIFARHEGRFRWSTDHDGCSRKRTRCGNSSVVSARANGGAFILFGRNLQSGTQLRKLIDDLRDLSDIEPIITIDQEGGRVSRLRRIGNEPPNAQQL